MDVDQTSRRFQILADVKRRRIISLLLRKSRTVSAIAEELGIERTLLSHNLRVLKQEGLVDSERVGKEVFYSVPEDIILNQDEGIIDLECCQIAFK